MCHGPGVQAQRVHHRDRGGDTRRRVVVEPAVVGHRSSGVDGRPVHSFRTRAGSRRGGGRHRIQIRAAFRRDRTRDRQSLDLGFASQRFAWEDSAPLAVLVALRRRLATIDLPFSFALDVDDEVRHRVEQLRESAREPRHRVVGSRLLRGKAREGVVQPD